MGFPIQNVIVLVVTGILGGGHTQNMNHDPGDSSRDLLIPDRGRSPTTLERVTYITIPKRSQRIDKTMIIHHSCIHHSFNIRSLHVHHSSIPENHPFMFYSPRKLTAGTHKLVVCCQMFLLFLLWNVHFQVKFSR